MTNRDRDGTVAGTDSKYIAAAMADALSTLGATYAAADMIRDATSRAHDMVWAIVDEEGYEWQSRKVDDIRKVMSMLSNIVLRAIVERNRT